MTHENILISLSTILFLSIGGQYIAWRFNLPAILFLLIFGFVAGPITHFINPDLLLGDLLMPVISILVAIILFEGGLSLRFREIRETRNIIMSLLTVGLLITWILVTVGAFFILKMDFELCFLLGAVLTVTGPTVIGPLLLHIQPSEKVNNILKWEGLIVDPLGAMLAFLTFEAIFIQGLSNSWISMTLGIFKTILIASCCGVVAAAILIILMLRYWIPDRLQGVFSLMLVIVTFTVSNYFQPESGLWASTIMGIVLANQQKISINHLEEFKESLRILFVSSLFVILGARFQFSNFSYFDLKTAVFLVLLILIRPISVFLATMKTSIDFKEKLFISWMAPRGIVAAAVASIFALHLTDIGYSQAEYWKSVIFFAIIFTVLVYGTSANFVAKKLGIANSKPQGVLIVGAHSWARILAKALINMGIKVLLIDTNPSNISRAKARKLAAIQGNVLSENIFYKLSLNGIGNILALTQNNEANSLIAINFIRNFGRAKVFQIHPEVNSGEEEKLHAKHLRGRFLFSHDITHDFLAKKITSDSSIKKIMFSDTSTYSNFLKDSNTKIIPLFLITQKKELRVYTTDQNFNPKPGDTLFYLNIIDNITSPA